MSSNPWYMNAWVYCASLEKNNNYKIFIGRFPLYPICCSHCETVLVT